MAASGSDRTLRCRRHWHVGAQDCRWRARSRLRTQRPGWSSAGAARGGDRVKLLTYDAGTGPRAGILVGDDVVDATTLLGSERTLRDIRAVLEFSEDSVEQLRSGLERVAAPRVPLES